MEEFIQIENGIYEDEAVDEVTTRSLSYGTWFQQLDYLVNEAPEMEFITGRGLHLDSYKLLDYTIDKDAPLNEDTRMPLYNDPGDANNFVILPLSEIKRVDPATGSRYEDGLKKILLDEYSPSELKNVQLTWRYKDETFTTICFVTGKEVVYDDILSHIRLIILSEPRIDAVIKINVPRLKIESENETSPPDDCNPSSRNGSSPRAEMFSWSGGLMAYAQCEFSISGCVDQANNKYLESAEYDSEAWTSNGYYHAVADAKLISFEMGLNGYAHFEFVCAVGSNPIGIEWNGLKFIITGGASQGYTGGTIMAASSL
jgi:hypothetical protein